MDSIADLLTLTGRDGTPLHLLAAVETRDELHAEGYITQTKLRAGRVFTTPSGSRYRLPKGLKPAVTWTHPLMLERK